MFREVYPKIYPGGRFKLDDAPAPSSPPTEYFRKSANKLSSWADLEEEELGFTKTIHQHPNIANLPGIAFGKLQRLTFTPQEKARHHEVVDPASDPALGFYRHLSRLS
ncbi:hypothetical protein V8E53_000514 [Lactarius tabidus]